MGTGFLQRLTSVATWGVLSALFSLFVSTGAIVLAALILVLLLGVIAVMLGPQFIAASWLIGSPTIFGFPNEVLRALPFVTMERLMLVVLVAMVFLRYTFSKQKTRWLPLETTILIFLVYTFVNMAYHTSEISLRRDGWLWVQYLLPMASFIVSRRIEWTESGLKTLLAALTVTGVFVAIAGILQSRFGISIFTRNYQTITIGHTGRAYGPFSSAHTYVASLFIFLTISLLQYSFYKDKVLRALLILGMGIMAIGIIFGVSRGPWIGAALAFAVIFIKHPAARPLIITGLCIVFVAGIGLSVVMVDQLGAIGDRLFNVKSLLGRAAAWATAVNMVSDHPFFGVGFGAATYAENKAFYITGIGSLTAQYADFHGVPHNQYLHVAVLSGITGLVLFLMILIRLVKLMFQVFHNKNENSFRRCLALYVGAIVMALMFNSIFSDTYLQDYFWVLAYFLAGVAAGNIDYLSRRETEYAAGGKPFEPVRE